MNANSKIVCSFVILIMIYIISRSQFGQLALIAVLPSHERVVPLFPFLNLLVIDSIASIAIYKE